MVVVKQFPEIYRILYRGVRAAVGAGLAQLVLVPDWQSAPERVLFVAFLAGFLPALGMWARDLLDKVFGWDEKSFIQKVMPI